MKRVTLSDVAREAGASPASVSAALNGNASGNMRLSAATRQRIIDTAARLGYIPNPIARSLSTGRSGVVGLAFPYLDAFVDRNPFCSMVMNGVFSEAILSGVNVMMYTATDGFWASKHRVDPRVDGLILVLPPADHPILEKCLETSFPCVSVVCEDQPLPAMTVNADDLRGGIIATQHLIGLGHQRIAILHGSDKNPTNAPRLQGFRLAMAQAGLKVREDLVIEAGFDWKPGFESVETLLDRPRSDWPTAIFAVNDLCAAGAMRAMKHRGVNVPDDIALVGFDDTWFAPTVQPALTTVRMPIKEMGSMAVRMLVGELGNQPPTQRKAVLDVSLTIRQSCGSTSQSFAQDFLEF